MRSDVDWDEAASRYEEKILGMLEERAGFAGLRDNIEEKRIITPRDWQTDYNVYEGATFNLAHTMGQVLYYRPHNRFQEIECCYLVGGGTHPGSGLPTIYESARISSNLICNEMGVDYALAEKTLL
jgi:phytoene desaturase